MKEKEYIEDAYAALIQSMFKVFFQSFTSAQGDKTAEAAAESTFKNGLAHALYVRERAIAALP